MDDGTAQYETPGPVQEPPPAIAPRAAAPEAAVGSAGASEEQILYARILSAGMQAGLLILLVTFTLYVSGVVGPAIPIADLPDYWSLSVDRYLEALNADLLHREHALTGWWWLSALNRGDYLNLVGIVILASVTAVCFVGIVPTLLRKRDYVYAAIAVVETLVLALAASGILAAGH